MGTDQEEEAGISRLREAERLDRLQAELEGVVAKDSKYWLQNDAKFRAVAQVRVSLFFYLQLIAPLFLIRVLRMSSLRSLWPHLTLLPLARRTLWVGQKSRGFGTQLHKLKQR